MASGLTDEEERKTKQFLEDINRELHDQNEGPVSWNTAVKFLMARKFDVRRALDLYRSHESVRDREGLKNVDPYTDSIKRELLTEKFTVLPGRDSCGAAIALFTAHKHLPITTTHQAVLKGLVFQLDAALDSVDTQRNGLVFIYDMSHSKYHNFDYDLSIKILNLLKGSYPARLKKVLIVTAPLWFKAPFKFLRLFIREKLRDRVFTVSLSQLPVHIPMSSLPKHLAGREEHNHREWLKKCLHTMAGKVPEVNCANIGTFFETEPHSLLELSVSSMSSAATSPTREDHSFLSSDLDSEAVPDSPQEKHNFESPEKNTAIIERENGNRTNTTTTENGPHVPSKRSSDSDTVIQGDQPPPPLPRKRKPMPSGDEDKIGDESDSIHAADVGGMIIKELVEYVRIKGRKGLYKEYAQIKAEPPIGTFNASKAQKNLPKNRYTDVLCLDHSRVKLAVEELDPSSDYINANFVDGYKQKNAYISTQGPLPWTFGDFWRMVWEQSVLVIVMTTRCVERSRHKCGQYWPTEEETAGEYGRFIVVNAGIDKFNDYMRTSLVLQDTLTAESREVTHFQFTSWPDYGVPHSAEAFLDFMFHVREHQANRVKDQGADWSGHPLGPPIVVHCSAGIGRTGTFITMDINTKRLADIHTVEVKQTVKKIRTQRAFSIQMPDQYVFCHLALIEHAQRQSMLGQVDLDHFEDSSSESE